MQRDYANSGSTVETGWTPGQPGSTTAGMTDPNRADDERRHREPVPSAAYRAREMFAEFPAERYAPLGLTSGAVMGLAAAATALWGFQRWRRERNRPLNHMRRQVRHVADRLGKTMSDPRIASMAAPAPAGAGIGGTAVLLASAVLLSRLARGSNGRDLPVELPKTDVGRYVSGVSDDLMRRAKKLPLNAGDIHFPSLGKGLNLTGKAHLPKGVHMPSVEPSPSRIGLPLGGIALVGGAGYLLWRMLRGNSVDLGHPPRARHQGV